MVMIVFDSWFYQQTQHYKLSPMFISMAQQKPSNQQREKSRQWIDRERERDREIGGDMWGGEGGSEREKGYK